MILGVIVMVFDGFLLLVGWAFSGGGLPDDVVLVIGLIVIGIALFYSGNQLRKQ